MIVDKALTEGEWLLLQAVNDGVIDEHVDLPDAVVQALFDAFDAEDWDEVEDILDKATPRGNADHLRRYWAHGKGGESIGWGSKGDFMRCVERVSKYMDTEQAKGYCNLRHKQATGKYPGEGHGKVKKAHVPGTASGEPIPKCHFCKETSTGWVLHSEGRAFVPHCEQHSEEAVSAAEHCTPDGSRDPGNVDRIGAYAEARKSLQAASAPIARRADGATLHEADGEAGFGEPMAYIAIGGESFEPRPLRAILARGDWEPVLAKAVVIAEFEKRTYVRDSIGRFATHSGMRIGETKDDAKAQANLVDDATYLSALPADLVDKMHATAAGMGTDAAALEANIDATLDRAIARTGNPPRGHDWYEQAHAECVAVGKDSGLSTETSVGMVAAISPQMAWAPNLAVARYMAENRDADVDVLALSKPLTKRMPKPGGGNEQVTRSAYEWAAIEVSGRKIDGSVREVPPLASLDGKKMGDLDPYVAAALLKGHAQTGVGMFNGKPLAGSALAVADDITGKVQRVNFPGTIQTGRAMRIARGEDANGIINGHKVRSFRNNLARPLMADGDVTVDSHAVSLALGRKISSSSQEYKDFASKPTSATLGVSGSYALWADAYRSVAERRGLRVQQLQSITWIQWRHEHPDNARVTHAMD